MPGKKREKPRFLITYISVYGSPASTFVALLLFFNGNSLTVKTGKIQIEFSLFRLMECTRHLSETMGIITGLHHAAKEYDTNDLFPLEVDGLAFVLPNDNGKIGASYDVVEQWILRKGFEELVAGLTQSLIEACRFLKLRSAALKSETNPFIGEETANKKLGVIHDDPVKYHFPTLIETIEAELGLALALRIEILSINQMRNCLVHRNGTVSKKDVNNDAKDTLVMWYRDIRHHIETADGIFPLTIETKKKYQVIRNLLSEEVQMEHCTPIDVKVGFDTNVLNGALYTTVMFLREIIDHLPIEQHLKDALLPLPVVNLAYTSTPNNV